MTSIKLYYHDPVEVNPVTSWTGLSSLLRDTERINITSVKDPHIKGLFDYARPDAVITVNGEPALSIEQTRMNPSGHNIPQRFLFHLRSAELNVPSVLYYPEYARRTFSDPNPRYLNIRVPLAQLRLSKIFNIPALSVFWPTDKQTLWPTDRQESHKRMTEIVDVIISNTENKDILLQQPKIKNALSDMNRVVMKYAKGYTKNSSVRLLFPDGLRGVSIDPPLSAKLLKTEDFLDSLDHLNRTPEWSYIENKIKLRKITLVFTATASKHGTGDDSEHPWPGYFAMIDILYLRTDNGRSPNDRIANLVYKLPIPYSRFLSRVNQGPILKGNNRIVDLLADLILLNGGVVAGRTIRENNQARCVLVE